MSVHRAPLLNALPELELGATGQTTIGTSAWYYDLARRDLACARRALEHVQLLERQRRELAPDTARGRRAQWWIDADRHRCQRISETFADAAAWLSLALHSRENARRRRSLERAL